MVLATAICHGLCGPLLGNLTATDDWRGRCETGACALSLGLSTPETQFAVLASVSPARHQNRASFTDHPRCCFTTNPSFRTLGERGEEQIALASASALIDPVGRVKARGRRGGWLTLYIEHWRLLLQASPEHPPCSLLRPLIWRPAIVRADSPPAPMNVGDTSHLKNRWTTPRDIQS